ncbi:ArsR/SmtB family transcription factor [Streptomyces carpinensis]|uniref:Helix-turn-helix domain-containing protein n=1 Tax=Streptomyces carpinensis TaxID=66369 RepID=A0ABV1W0Q6_9ACTN|nr:helix-turn-helix domain-containing protein [Streptomyces carpinensis]
MRLHFTSADLRKINLMAPGTLEEMAFSMRSLRAGPTGGQVRRPGLEQWHRRTRTGAAARAGVLFDLVPREGFLPDFLSQLSDDLDTSVALAAQTPTAQLAADIAQLTGSTHTNHRLRELAEGTSAARQGLAADLRHYFSSCLADLWPQVQAGAAADRALRAETLMRGGVDGLLATLGTRWLWEPPILHIPSSRASDVDVPLCGWGLVLVPSYFGGPALLYRPERPTVLTYPMSAGEPPTGASDALGPLLGRTRAAVLAAIRHPAATTTVAERVGISLPSASQHATILRNAGLITTTRTGSAVLHTLSPLGEALLHGDTATR